MSKDPFFAEQMNGTGSPPLRPDDICQYRTSFTAIRAALVREACSPQAMSEDVMGLTGLVAVLSSYGIRTHVPSPWFFLSMKSVVKVVWALALQARPKSKRPIQSFILKM